MDLLRDEVLDGAVLDRSASFSLAMDKAREKLQRFQLTDPRFYITQLIQAFIASGAKNIKVRHDTELAAELSLTGYRLEIEFDGPGYQAYELENLYDYLFVSGRDRDKDRIRELAMGIVSCVALNPKEVRVRSGEREWQRLAEKAFKEETVKVPAQGNRFVISGPGAGTEVELLRSHCGCCAVELTLNGDTVATPSRNFMGMCPWPNFRFERGEIRGAAGLAYGEMSQSSLVFLRYGVEIARKWEKRIHPPVSMVVDAPTLRKNASQTDLVEDQAYFDCISQLQMVLVDFSTDLATRRIPSYNRHTVVGFLLTFFEEWFSPHSLLNPDDEPEEVKRLLKVRLFTDIHGKMHSISQIRDYYQADGYLSFASRRMPSVRTGDWVVLAPDEREAEVLRRLFPRVREVDAELARHQYSRHVVSRPDAPAAKTRGDLKFLSSLEASDAKGSYFIGIPDAYPSGKATIVYLHQRSWREMLTNIDGCSLWCQVLEIDTWNPGDVKRRARLCMESSLQELYGHLLVRLKAANRDPKFARTIFRAREHLAGYWHRRLAKKLDRRCVQDPQARMDLGREALGEEAWTARVFETRQFQQFSLADVATWLGTFDTLALVYGGPRTDDDHGVEASPVIASLLRQLFGEDRIVEASLRDARMLERRQQAPLPGAADGPPLVKPKVKTAEEEEEELARLREEFHRAQQGLDAEPPETEDGASEDEPETDSVPTDAEDQPRPATAEVKPAPAAAVAVVEKPAEAPARSESRRLIELFDSTPMLARRSFRRERVTGSLGVPQDGAGASIAVIRMDQLDRHDTEAVVRGWLELQSEDVDVAEVVRTETAYLYNKLAHNLSALETHHPDFRRGSRLLVRFLASDPEAVRAQLAEQPPSRKLCHLIFLPAAGRTQTNLVSLQQVVDQYGVLHVVHDEADDPGVDHPVAVVGTLVPERLYREIFGVELEVLESKKPQTDEQRLMAAVRAELWRLASDPTCMLTPDLLAGIEWGEPSRFYQLWGRYFVNHDPGTGSTELNPAHGVLKKVLKVFRKDPSVVAVLASSIYTAINRALEEIEDQHELAFLEALLDSHPEA